jgi:PEP-CTERM motif
MSPTRTQACAVFLLPLLAGMLALLLLAAFQVEARDAARVATQPASAPFRLEAPADVDWLQGVAPILQRIDPSEFGRPPSHLVSPAVEIAGPAEPLLTPVPEPSTGLLLVLGLCGIAARCRSARA